MLGGYDKSRTEFPDASSKTLPLDADNSRILSVPIQSISATNTLDGAGMLTNTSFVAVIDSTVPHMWLPLEACTKFEQAFGLTFDPDTGLYLVNDTIHTRLQQMNPSVLISLGSSNDPSETIQISFPYDAFDLEASHPLYPSNMSKTYFPIRRASDSSD